MKKQTCRHMGGRFFAWNAKFQFVVQSYNDLVGAATRRPLRLSVTNSPKPNANSQHFSARATNGRPYVIHVTLRDKHQFTKQKLRR
ncbi:MAG: hypothetical protein IKT52_12145 [Oscillospiraceae bacterium]|nr:hypothetical protein [Oscillospiraceae bacterium]